jgi:hypothetical protein
MDSVTLEFLSEDRLSRTSWRFFLLHRTLIVDSYLEETRETTRKKFQKVRHWSRLFESRADIKKDEIPFTDEIAAQAKEAFIERIRNEVRVEFQK